METTPNIDDGNNQHDYTEHNRDHFNKSAESYDSYSFKTLIAAKCAKAILEKLGNEFDEEKTEVMDFACGTGLVSQELSSHVKSIIGVDLSQNMVDVYNRKAWQQGIPKYEMEAVCLELKEGDQCDQLNGKNFDFIICVSAYHHIDDLVTITKLLSTYLKPNDGQLIVLDLKKDQRHSHIFHTNTHKHDGHENHLHNVIAHKGGFDPEELKQVFIETGLLKDVEVEVVFQFEKYVENEDKTYVFEYLMARGKRSSN